MPKIAKSGNSVMVALPRKELEELGLSIGDEVIVRRRGSVLEIVPAEPRVRPDVRRAMDATLARFEPALKRLAE